MSLMVGHNCPRCGLDTPEVACADCGETVVWSRERGSHCSACGLSAATFTCGECGLASELDMRQDETRIEPVMASAAPAPADALAQPRPRASLAVLAAVPALSGRRVLVIALSLAVPLLVLAALPAGDRQRPASPPRVAAIPAIVPTNMLPVPVQPPLQMSSWRAGDPPPPTVYVLDTTPPPSVARAVEPSQPRESSLRQFFRSGRTAQSSEPPERLLP